MKEIVFVYYCEALYKLSSLPGSFSTITCVYGSAHKAEYEEEERKEMNPHKT